MAGKIPNDSNEIRKDSLDFMRSMNLSILIWTIQKFEGLHGVTYRDVLETFKRQETITRGYLRECLDKDFIRKEKDKKDKRLTRYFVTDKGVKFMASINSAHAQLQIALSLYNES